MKKIPRQYRLIVALTALVFTVALLAAANQNMLPVSFWSQHTVQRTPLAVTAMPVSRMNKPMPIIRTGSIERSISVPLNADFAGLVNEVYITEGQAVKSGQPLFKLQAFSTPAANQPAAGSQSQAAYDNALKEFNRLQKLYDLGAIPRRQLEMAVNQLQAAKEGLANVSNTPSSATVNGVITIKAPIDGIVTGLAAISGKAVQAGQQLLSLGSGQDVAAVIRLEQNDLYLVPLSTPAAIEVSQQAIAGQVSRIYPQIEANQTLFFIAHIKLGTSPAGLLKPGMPVTVRINTSQLSAVSAVPTAAIFQNNQGQKFIFLAANGKAALQQVSIGETIGDLTEITSSLPQDSLVITSNMSDIKDGDAVTVNQQ